MDTPLVLVDGSTFFASDSVGDTSSDEDGLFFGDMRHVSVWRMTVEGTPVRLLTCDTRSATRRVSTPRCRAPGWG